MTSPTTRVSGVLAVAVLVACLPALTACGTTSTTSGQPSISPSASYDGPPISQAQARAVRDRALAYWAAYNDYDAARAITFLARDYRPAKAEVVRSEVGRIKTFGVQLGVSQKSPPELIGDGRAEIYLNMKTPTGMRTVLMKFTDQGGVWMITYSEEVK